MPIINKGNKKKREYNGVGNRAERQKMYRLPQWRKLSKAFLMLHPLCSECLKRGLVTPAIHVHHIVSFMTVNDELKRKELLLDPNNLQALCQDCHNDKHNRKDK